MDNSVEAMNNKPELAVQRGGDQVVFINYDPFVGFLSGRYCSSGIDEGQWNGANRYFLFFYEMDTSDTPPNDNPYNDELRHRDTPYHDELKHRDTTLPANDTTDAVIGSWIQQTLEQYPNVQLNDDVAISDLDKLIAQEKDSFNKQRRKKRGPLKWRPKFALKPRDKRALYGGRSVSGQE